MQKPDKIYIENTNLLHTLSDAVNPGTEREVFFVNQLSLSHQIEYSKTAADFTIDHTYTIEVGGHSKGNKQVEGVANGYIAGICHWQQNSIVAFWIPLLIAYQDFKFARKVVQF